MCVIQVQITSGLWFEFSSSSTLSGIELRSVYPGETRWRFNEEILDFLLIKMMLIDISIRIPFFKKNSICKENKMWNR